MSEFIFPTAFRDFILSSLPDDTSLHGQAPQGSHIYLPATHVKALHPNTMLIEGGRGAGKSFWWAVLQNPAYRAVISPQSELNQSTLVSIGFGESPKPRDYPSKDTLLYLLEKKIEPRNIWRTIVFFHIASNQAPTGFTELSSWERRIDWVHQNPEDVESLLFKIDEDLDQTNNYHLVLFDALDRTADDWTSLNALVRGLLQVVLDFRPYKRLRLKVFARPDQLEDPSVRSFPDASKVMSNKVDLSWSRRDLYGLLWQYLANGSEAAFRGGCSKLLPSTQWLERAGVWLVPDAIAANEDNQKLIFSAIAGQWMGANARRGYSYSWLPSHLADARGAVSPRSFLAAIRHAAQDSVNRPRQEFALHYESIKKGVQEASKIRVREVEEDYPWIATLFSPLKGLSVPCTIEDIQSRWESDGTLQKLEVNIASASVRLPPVKITQGALGVLQDLRELGFIEQLKDMRINLPDVYRVGYGLGRRGGVKPVR